MPPVLDSKPVTKVADLVSYSRPDLFDYFCAHAGYHEDAPKLNYSIRVGSRLFLSADTHDLLSKLIQAVAVEKAKVTRLQNKRKK